MKKIQFVIILHFLAINTLFAQNTTVDILSGYDSIRTITTAVPFLTIAPDSRSGAMGEAGAGLTPDANSIHWNTAKLAFAEKDYAFAVSYTPWLRAIINDMALSYLSGYYRVSERGVFSASLLYFDLGDITFTDINAVELTTFTPNEYAITAGYGTQLSEKLGFGLNLKFINSNLTGGIDVGDVQTRPGRTAAGDLSAYYKSKMVVSGKPADLTLAATVSNVGAKIAYTNSVLDNKDFLPANLRLGAAFKSELDEYQTVTFALDLNKYLVPSPPVYSKTQMGPDGNPIIIAGIDPNTRSVPQGIFGSFTDAPGIPLDDGNGSPLLGEDGNVQVVKGSRFGEELREIIICTGLEYWYRDVFALRAGYFREHKTKGSREFLTFGFGVKYQFTEINVSYLTALKLNNPLANTLRFSIGFSFDKEEGKPTPAL